MTRAVFGLEPGWFAGGLFVVTCLLIMSANLMVVGFADRGGRPLRFVPFMLMVFPLLILSILTCSVYF